MLRPGSAASRKDSKARSRSPTTGWWRRLTPVRVDAHVVGGPAACGTRRCGWTARRSGPELAGRTGRGRLRRAAGDGVVGDLVPVAEELGRRAGRGRRTGRCWRGLTGVGVARARTAPRPRALAARMSRRPLSTNAGVPIIESRTRCTVGPDPLRPQARGVAGGCVPAARSRSRRCARSASSSCSACATPSMHAVGDADGVAALEPGVVLDARSRRAGRPPRGVVPRPVGGLRRTPAARPVPG